MPAGKQCPDVMYTLPHLIINIISKTVANEWRGYPDVRHATLALYAGLIVGAVFWGTTADVWGSVDVNI